MVCDLTNWVRTEGHYFRLHCLRLKFLRYTIDGKLQGKSWDFQEMVQIVELYRSRFLMHGHFMFRHVFRKVTTQKVYSSCCWINLFKWYRHWNSMNCSHCDWLFQQEMKIDGWLHCEKLIVPPQEICDIEFENSHTLIRVHAFVEL